MPGVPRDSNPCFRRERAGRRPQRSPVFTWCLLLLGLNTCKHACVRLRSGIQMETRWRPTTMARCCADRHAVEPGAALAAQGDILAAARARPRGRLLPAARAPAPGGRGAGRRRLPDEALGAADDAAPAGLSWAQAQAAARAWASRQTAAGPETVAAICADYVADLRARKGERAAGEAEGRLRKHLLPVLGGRPLAELTAADITAWRNGMVRNGSEDAVRRSRDTANRMLAIGQGRVQPRLQHRPRRRRSGLAPGQGVQGRRRGAQGDPDRGRAPAPGRRLRARPARAGRCRRRDRRAARRARLGPGARPRCRRGAAQGQRQDRCAGDPPAAGGARLLRRLRERQAAGRSAAHRRRWPGVDGSLYRRPFAAAVARAGLDPDDDVLRAAPQLHQPRARAPACRPRRSPTTAARASR